MLAIDRAVYLFKDRKDWIVFQVKMWGKSKINLLSQSWVNRSDKDQKEEMIYYDIRDRYPE